MTAVLANDKGADQLAFHRRSFGTGQGAFMKGACNFGKNRMTQQAKVHVNISTIDEEQLETPPFAS
jgi:hypothetical protein